MENQQAPILNITSGDSAGSLLEKATIPGEIFVWHDILYDGLRNPGWPTGQTLQDRARFIETETANGLDRKQALKILTDQYQKLEKCHPQTLILLWFDACLFDQSMLVHILACLDHLNHQTVELICVDAFPGISPYNGLGQLTPEQLASVRDQKQPITREQFEFAKIVDTAFAYQDMNLLTQLSQNQDPPFPWIPKAIKRWLAEQPDPVTGFGKLETLVLSAVDQDMTHPVDIFKFAAKNDDPPQYWGDTMLWSKINGLADRNPPVLIISGPEKRLPQFMHDLDLNQFTIKRSPDGV